MSTTASDLTEFAPAKREPTKVVRSQFRSFVGSHCRAFLDALPNMVMALNCQRQVVFANQACVSFLGHNDVEEMLGRRPGEVLGCVNADMNSGGCGTSRHCRSCGAVAAILSAINGSVGSEDCKLLRRGSSNIEGLDIHVTASPISIEGQGFIIFTITDITHESRRRSMEHIFFHDVLNLAGGISGLTELLEDMVPDALKEDFTILRSATDTLVDEIIAQRDIVKAENNELKVIFADVNTLDLLNTLRRLYLHAPVAQGRTISLDPQCRNVRVCTDARLVHRVLGNMLKNAMEALPSGGAALISCAEEGESVVFSVQNHGHIPQSLQDNMFRRSFSTKGTGRGMGTYSMLLLAERYLGGSVGFRSSEAEGTVFFLRIQKTASAEQGCSAPASR